MSPHRALLVCMALIPGLRAQALGSEVATSVFFEQSLVADKILSPKGLPHQLITTPNGLAAAIIYKAVSEVYPFDQLQRDLDFIGNKFKSGDLADVPEETWTHIIYRAVSEGYPFDQLLDFIGNTFKSGDLADGPEETWTRVGGFVAMVAGSGGFVAMVAGRGFMTYVTEPFADRKWMTTVAIGYATAVWTPTVFSYMTGLTGPFQRLGSGGGVTLALYGFAAIGNAEICPMVDGEPLKKACVDYKGPATVLCYDLRGRLLTVDFVGVCYEDGTNCMADDAWWVGEQWRLNLTSDQWLYRDARAKHHADVGCTTWPSQRPPSERPSPNFVSKFREQRSFILHELQPRVLSGPPGEFVWNALTEEADARDVNADVKQALGWINAGLLLLGRATQDSMQQDKVAESEAYLALRGFLVKYGVMLSANLRKA